MSLTEPACSRSPPALQQGKTSHRGHRLECLVRTPCESSVDRTNENLSAWSFLPRRHEGRGGEADGGVGAPLQSRQQEQPRSYDYPYTSLKLCPAAGLLTGQEQPAKRGDRPASSCDTVVMVYTTWLLTHTMVVWTKLSSPCTYGRKLVRREVCRGGGLEDPFLPLLWLMEAAPRQPIVNERSFPTAVKILISLPTLLTWMNI